jgi:hypothetical protein
VIFVSIKYDKQYLQKLQKRYLKAKKKEKQTILDEFTKTTKYDRKYAIKLLRGSYRHRTKAIQRPRSKIYSSIDASVLVKVCDLFDWICSKRVQPAIRIGLTELHKAEKLHISAEQKKRLCGISPATIDRLLTRHNKRPKQKGRSYTKPGTLLKHQIPIRTFSEWTENTAGFFEIDLCGHDGGLAKGDFGWTLNFIDVKVCWAEQVAVKNKAQVHVFAGIKTIRSRLPFSLLGIDSDSGSEFINHHLLNYCTAEKITFTRGRAGKKNDNPYVEQKNDSIVRNWVGYGRYDTDEQIAVLNELYAVLRLYLNFFVPVMKLKKKVRIGSKVRKRYDKAKTPYHRVLRAKDISVEVKEKLKKQRKTLNLVFLKEQIDSVLERLKPTPVR